MREALDRARKELELARRDGQRRRAAAEAALVDQAGRMKLRDETTRAKPRASSWGPCRVKLPSGFAAAVRAEVLAERSERLARIKAR